MLTNLTKEDLIQFEDEIADCFNNAEIRAPVHLYHGNEDQIIEIFTKQNIKDEDWVLCSWRSHYQCLLKGVPKLQLKKAILEKILKKLIKFGLRQISFGKLKQSIQLKQI